MKFECEFTLEDAIVWYYTYWVWWSWCVRFGECLCSWEIPAKELGRLTMLATFFQMVENNVEMYNCPSDSEGWGTGSRWPNRCSGLADEIRKYLHLTYAILYTLHHILSTLETQYKIDVIQIVTLLYYLGNVRKKYMYLLQMQFIFWI